MKIFNFFIVAISFCAIAHGGSFFNKEKEKDMDANEVKEYVADKAEYMSDMTAAQWYRVKGNAIQLKGQTKELYGRLTDDELTQIEGKKDRFVGYVVNKYGYSKGQANQAWEDLKESIKD